MNRKLKVLGLALVAVFALTSVSASAASAAQFTSSVEGVTTLNGEQSGEGDVFTVNAGVTTCSVATYLGNAENGSAIAEAHPSYSGCSVEPIGSATIDTTGCDYIFDAAKTVDIDCGSGAIKVVAKVFGITKCTISVPSQENLAVVDYVNNGGSPSTITVDVSMEGIEYWQVAGSGFGACNSEGSSESPLTNGKYTGEALVEGEQGGTPVSISHDE